MNAGGADAALSAAMGHPRDLQGVQIVGRADALDGGDVGVGRQLFQRRLAGADRLAVDDDGAGSALTILATDLAAGEQHLFAQDIGEGRLAVGDDPAVDAVYDE